MFDLITLHLSHDRAATLIAGRQRLQVFAEMRLDLTLGLVEEAEVVAVSTHSVGYAYLVS